MFCLWMILLLFEENFSSWYLHVRSHFISVCKSQFNPFQGSVAFHLETSHLFCRANQLTGFYMKRNTTLKWDKRLKVVSWKTNFANSTKLTLKSHHSVKYIRVQEKVSELFSCIPCKEALQEVVSYFWWMKISSFLL